jgi:flagellar hook-length control protein FliK
MTPATALKATANKSESNNDKAVTSEPSAFNTMLSNQLQTQSQSRQLQDRQSQDRKSVDKLTQDRQLQGRQLQDRQIQDRQMQDKQVNDKQVNDKQVQNKQVPDKQLQGSPDMARQDASKAKLAPTETGSEPGGKAGVKADKVQLTDARKALADNTPPAAAALTAAEVKAELPLADDATLKAALPANNTAETNAANLVAAFNVAVVNPQLQAQSAEAAGSRQVQMDKVLNQALTQSKAGVAADKDAALESKAGLQKANWLDTALPTAVRQTAADALAQTKHQQQNAMQQTVSAQAGSQPSAIQANNSPQNLAQQAAAIAATMPPALPALAAGPALVQAGSSNFMHTAPGKSGWDQAISQKVLWMAGEGGVQSATLTLNPPDLGPLQVVIHVNNDMVEAQFMSDNADVRQALQDGLANLRDKMQEAGIQLGQTNVSAGGQAQQEFAQTAQGQRAQRMTGGDASSASETVTTRPANVRSANGLVDTFA